MKRRSFLASTGAAIGGLSVFPGSVAAHSPQALTEAGLRLVETAVKGGFGSGFRVISANRQKGRITALIEHHENYLEVASKDLTNWTVLRASQM